MRRLMTVLLLVSAVCCAEPAQNSDKFQRCIDKAGTQSAMHACASEEAQRADAKMNAIYQKLLLAARNQSGAVEKIRATQGAWIAYQDAYIAAMYPAENKRAVYGSSFPTEVNLLRAKLALQQLEALTELLKQYSNPK